MRSFQTHKGEVASLDTPLLEVRNDASHSEMDSAEETYSPTPFEVRMTNPNEPAFPGLEKVQQYDDEKSQYVDVYQSMGGLTKREYFAAMAMQGMLANPSFRTDQDKIAEWALQNADALIAELSKESK